MYNVLGFFFGFLKISLNFRYAYANAFSRFSEAIQDYLTNIDNTPDPSITKEHFVEELDKAHETLFNSWLSGKGRISFPNIPFCTSSFSVTKLSTYVNSVLDLNFKLDIQT